MAQSIFITSAEGHSGKSTVALGVLDALSHATPRVGVFRAIARSTVERDYVLEMLLDARRRRPRYDECIGVTYDDVRNDPDAALATIVERYKAVEAQCDAVVIVGSDYTDVGSPAELAYNARIAANLGAPVLLVLGGRADAGEPARAAGLDAARAPPPRWARSPSLALAELAHGRAELFAVVANRADPDSAPDAIAAIERSLSASLGAAHETVPVWAIPEDRIPGRAVGARRHALGRRRAASRVIPSCSPGKPSASSSPGMSMVNVLPRLAEERDRGDPGGPHRGAAGDPARQHLGHLPVACGDRPERPLRAARADQPPDRRTRVDRCRSSRPTSAPTRRPCASWARAGAWPPTRSAATTPRSRTFETQRRHRGADSRLLGLARSTVVTPLMFEYELIDRARSDRRTDRAARGRRRPRAARCGDRAQARHRRPGDPRRADRGARARDRAGHRHPGAPRCSRRSTPSTSHEVRRGVRAPARPQGRHVRAGRRHGDRRVVLRHAHGAPRPRRRHGLGRRAHDRAHDPAGVRDHQDQARASRSSRRCS